MQDIPRHGEGIAGRSLTGADPRASGERHSFLLKLSDALRARTDEAGIGATCVRMLAEHMQLDRAHVARLSSVAGAAHIGPEHYSSHLSPLAGIYSYSDHRDVMGRLKVGPMVIDDVANDGAMGEADKEGMAAVGVAAIIVVHLHRGEQGAVWALTAASSAPREWTLEDLRLVEDVAERVWASIERARAETALRESEERLSKLLELMPAAVYTCDAEGKLTYFNRRAAELWGREPELGDPQEKFCGSFRMWTPEGALVRHEDCPMATALREGKTARNIEVVIEQPSGALIVAQVNIDPRFDQGGRITGGINVFTDITESKQANQRQRLLLAELQHRVRNILATIRSIVHRSTETSDTVEDLAMHLDGRINALARTQVMLTRNPGAGVDLEDIVREELLGQPSIEQQVEIEGPAIDLSPKAAEVVTLALHELATNAIKYGALRDTRGRIAIVWRIIEHEGERWLRLAWAESGVKVLATAPRREGFGSELITRRVPYELSGTGTFELRPGGVHAIVEFPLRPGGSILETAERK